jgi:transposase-like protein
MKKVLASMTVAGLLVAGGVSAAGAAGPGGPGGPGEKGHGGYGIAAQTAATTIGVTPEDLRNQVRSGKTIAQVATEHGVDPNTVVTAIITAVTQQIDQKAAAGTVDPSRAEQAKQKLPDFANRFVNETKLRRRYRILKDAVKAAATEIGVSADQLKDALKNGKSIAQVAKEHDKSVDDVVDAIVKESTSDIDQAVKDGKLDSSKADEIKQKLPDRVKKLVNRERRGGFATTSSAR